MRMIDADALKEKIDSMWNGRPLSSLGARILVTIDEAPTIDADRPQGEWIPSDTDGFVCSVCKNGYRNQPTLMGRPMFEYCPVCGARMKGADDEYERAVEQMEHDMLYEPTYNPEDGSM